MKKENFSVGITTDLAEWELTFELLQSTLFKGIELPACLLDNPKLPVLLRKNNIHIILISIMFYIMIFRMRT